MTPYQSFKLFLVDLTSLSKDALHVYVGLAVMLLAAVLLKRSLRDWRPLAAVVLAALAGETWDLIGDYHRSLRPRWHANWKDIWNTLFWPTTLFLLARFTKVLKR